MENHHAYKHQLQYLFSARLSGYKLYSMGQYPCAVKTSGDHAITVEVFETGHQETADDIHRLELEEGYYCDEHMINGVMTRIYLYHHPGNYQEVPGGDWVTFFRQRSNSG
jgi:gamma-glutamylcyclotransferase (GGCT)/AIG2-like uncharacterized protein YtfP